MKAFLLLAALVCIFMSGAAQAQLFVQNFSSSTNVADYVSTTPNNGQFNAIGTAGAATTVSINGGTLQYTRTSATGSAGTFSRTTDFPFVPAAIIYEVDITVSGNSTAQTTAAVFQVGSGFSTNNSAEANANVYARFGINLSATTGCFSIRNISTSTNSAEVCGTQRITWVMNNSNTTLTYTAPDNSQQTVAIDTADIYIGTTLVFDDVAVLTPTQTITDLKFAFTAGIGTIQIDNIEINSFATLTASAAAISGRVTNSRGQGLRNITLILAGGDLDQPLYARTNNFGYYQFTEVPVGQTYVVQVMAKQFSFREPAQVVFLDGGNVVLNFTVDRRW